VDLSSCAGHVCERCDAFRDTLRALGLRAGDLTDGWRAAGGDVECGWAKSSAAIEDCDCCEVTEAVRRMERLHELMMIRRKQIRK
jgi:hypothetical protein